MAVGPRWRRIGLFLGVALSCVAFAVATGQASAATVPADRFRDLLPWIPGLTALLILATRWGEQRRQLRQHDDALDELEDVARTIMPRPDVERLVERVESRIGDRIDELKGDLTRQIDGLYQVLGAERRHGPRGPAT